MKNRLACAVAAATLAASAVYADTTQITASVGLDPAEATGFTLQEIVRMKRNAESGRDEQIATPAVAHAPGRASRSQLISEAGAGGPEAAAASLNDLARMKRNREARRDEVQPIVSGRSLSPEAPGWAQFARSAGLDADAPQRMDLSEIYLVRIRKTSDDD